MKKNILPEGITQEMIDAAKEKYGAEKIRLATLTNGVKELKVLIRVPDRATYNQFDKWAISDPTRAKDILITNCLLSHKEEVDKSDEYYFGCYHAISQILPLHAAIVEVI